MNDSPELALPHPIILLISRAEKLWKEKIESQSRTIEEAYHEYRRRYSQSRRPRSNFVGLCQGFREETTSRI